MALRKKGVFFTFIAVVFLSLLILSLSVGNNYRLRQLSFATETRINSMDLFVSDVEDDVGRGAYIAGYRSFVALTDQVVSTGDYLDDVDTSFIELFFNGTFNGTDSSLLANNTFNDWIDKISNEAEKIGLFLNFTIERVNLFQENPWEMGINVSFRLIVYNEDYLCRWDKTNVIETYIGLDGFEDPIYPLGTNGVIENRIERTPFDYFVNGTNVDNLMNHTYEGYYIEFTGAPSYLMRLEGNFSASEYGIESLVDIEDLVARGVSVEDKSIVDYIYFGSSNPDADEISGTPDWFKLDDELSMDGNQSHHGIYNVTGLVI